MGSHSPDGRWHRGDLRPGGYVSGPTQFALADAALWYLVFGAIGRVEPMALTSELSIRFIRPAIGETLWARATLDVAGRRNVVGTVRIWVDEREDRATAVAQGTYALPDPDHVNRWGQAPPRSTPAEELDRRHRHEAGGEERAHGAGVAGCDGGDQRLADRHHRADVSQQADTCSGRALGLDTDLVEATHDRARP